MSDMLTTIAGVYRKGRIELARQPSAMPDDTQVLVTFLTPKAVDLASERVTREDAEAIRSRLASFAEEWSSPEMSAYDNYDANRKQLEAR
jgi:hypothetical protein